MVLEVWQEHGAQGWPYLCRSREKHRQRSSGPRRTLTRPFLPGRQRPQEVSAWFSSARTETETLLPTQDLFLQKLGFSTVYKLSSRIRERPSSAPRCGRQVPCGRRTGSLLTAGVGPGPQPVHWIAAGPSVGKLSKYHQGRGTFTSTQSSALENERQTRGRSPPRPGGAVVLKVATAHFLGAPAPGGKQGHLCHQTPDVSSGGPTFHGAHSSPGAVARPSRVPGLCALHFSTPPLLDPAFNLLNLDFGPDASHIPHPTSHILKAAPYSLCSQANPHPCPSPGQPTLFGTGSDRLPGTKWLPAAIPAASRVVLSLSGGMLLWASFSFWTFILGGLAGFCLVG